MYTRNSMLQSASKEIRTMLVIHLCRVAIRVPSVPCVVSLVSEVVCNGWTPSTFQQTIYD